MTVPIRHTVDLKWGNILRETINVLKYFDHQFLPFLLKNALWWGVKPNVVQLQPFLRDFILKYDNLIR